MCTTAQKLHTWAHSSQNCAHPSDGPRRALWGDLAGATNTGLQARSLQDAACQACSGGIMHGPPALEPCTAPFPPRSQGPTHRRIRLKLPSGIPRSPAIQAGPPPSASGLAHLNLLAPPTTAAIRSTQPVHSAHQPGGATAPSSPGGAGLPPGSVQAVPPHPNSSCSPWMVHGLPNTTTNTTAQHAARPPRWPSRATGAAADETLHAARLSVHAPPQPQLPASAGGQQLHQPHQSLHPLAGSDQQDCKHHSARLDPLPQPVRAAGDHGPVRKRRRLNVRSLPSNPPVQPRGQPSQQQGHKVGRVRVQLSCMCTYVCPYMCVCVCLRLFIPVYACVRVRLLLCAHVWGVCSCDARLYGRA